MADCNKISSQENLEKFRKLSFEMKFKKAISWNKNDWIEYGQNNTKFQTIVNSANYWKKQLKEAFTEKNLIIALFNEKKDSYLKPLQIIEEIENKFPKVNITGFNRFKNKKYLAIELENIEMKNVLKEGLRRIEDYDVYFLSWGLDSEEIIIRTHWLPKEKGLKDITIIIEKYINITKIEEQFSFNENGKQYGNGITAFYGKLRLNITLEAIPHICKVGGLDCMLTIVGRPSLCLTCYTLGHRSFNCEKKYCRYCKSIKPKTHYCYKDINIKKSFAQVLENCTEEMEETIKIKEATQLENDITECNDSNNITHNSLEKENRQGLIINLEMKEDIKSEKKQHIDKETIENTDTQKFSEKERNENKEIKQTSFSSETKSSLTDGGKNKAFKLEEKMEWETYAHKRKAPLNDGDNFGSKNKPNSRNTYKKQPVKTKNEKSNNLFDGFLDEVNRREEKEDFKFDTAIIEMESVSDAVIEGYQGFDYPKRECAILLKVQAKESYGEKQLGNKVINNMQSHFKEENEVTSNYSEIMRDTAMEIKNKTLEIQRIELEEAALQRRWERSQAISVNISRNKNKKKKTKEKSLSVRIKNELF